MSSEDEISDDEIEMKLIANEDSTKVSLEMTCKTAIDMGDLILSLEEFLTELTRAEVQKREPGVKLH